jgi:hypothetical protein
MVLVVYLPHHRPMKADKLSNGNNHMNQLPDPETLSKHNNVDSAT